MNNILRVTLLFVLCSFLSFEESNAQSPDDWVPEEEFLNVGHRGVRGLVPENTIPSFKKAIDLGANTIEFDVHVTKDNKVVVYHDNSFTPSYTTKPDGSEISKEERKDYLFYDMNYSDIRAFIIGEKFYPLFPDQKPMKTYAPLLDEMIDSIEAYTAANDLPKVNYLLEIKSKPKADGVEQPKPEEFIDLLLEDLDPYLAELKSRLIIQSFDMRPIQVLHEKNPNIPLGFLTSDQTKTISQNLKELGFTPEYYNPNYSLINSEFLENAKKENMKVMPWTVNEMEDIQVMLKKEIDGIISDFPNRVHRAK